MWVFIALLIGLAGGAIATFLAMEPRRLALTEQKREQEERSNSLSRMAADLAASRKALDSAVEEAREKKAEFDARVISYDEIKAENSHLKRDLFNLHMGVRKLSLDVEHNRKSQALLDERSCDLAARFLKDNVKWISDNLTANNYATCKQRLQKVIDWCREINYEISAQQEQHFHAELKKEFELVVRAALEREEQARIRAQIREEQKREKEIQRQLEQLERERIALQAALSTALAAASNEQGEEIERLRARLAEAEANKQRAMSQAQLTRSGHIYVISNIGSFGQGVFKIGMTRRLEPQDRIRELGDASVPFPFDVHMVIACDDAPKLENALHRSFHKKRLNRANPRKEFFRVELEEICKVVEANHGAVEYIADAAALEFNQSQSMSEEDQEFIESVFEEAEEETEPTLS